MGMNAKVVGGREYGYPVVTRDYDATTPRTIRRKLTG
jgi:hypothetical protein